MDSIELQKRLLEIRRREMEIASQQRALTAESLDLQNERDSILVADVDAQIAKCAQALEQIKAGQEQYIKEP